MLLAGKGSGLPLQLFRNTSWMSAGSGFKNCSVFLVKTSACLLLCSSLSVLACCIVEAIAAPVRLMLRINA